MKKALFIMALYLVPFFSFSNIFNDGTIDLKAPKNFATVDCYSSTNSTFVGTSHPGSCDAQAMFKIFSDTRPPNEVRSIRNITFDGYYYLAEYEYCQNYLSSQSRCVDDIYYWNSSRSIGYQNNLREEVSCPNDQFPTYTYPILDDLGETVVSCADPAEIHLLDSCNSNSGNEYLTIPVTSSSGCYQQSDGSMCAYNSVSVGGGNDYYAMDLEGDCYANPDDLPDITQPQTQPDPISDECVSFGSGVLACPEDPANVCSSGSSFAGGSIADCQTGCGMVNDQFLCMDVDTDSDGLPDYNDPDIDGDGIPNADDLDSNGDGKDDPINGGSGSGDINLDLTPLVSELKKTNESLDTIEASFKTDHGLEPDGLNKDGRLDELNNDYQLDLEEFIAKGSSELGYTDKLVLGNSSSLSALPSNTCNPYSFHVAGKTLAFDVCPAAEKAKPILYWLVGMLTAWHIFFLINATLRGPI